MTVVIDAGGNGHESAPPDRGHDFVIVSQCLPVVVDGAGVCDVRRGSLIPALQPVVAARRGGWVGWTGVADATSRPFAVDHAWLHPVRLTQAEIADHLVGQCASTIAPLYHHALAAPAFSRKWRDAYRSVNQRFADTAAAVAAPGGVVWVHDYHLQLVPAMLRELRPDLLIGFFLQTPFPPVELFRQMPLRDEILSGLLGADLVGMQHPRAVHNLLSVAGALFDLIPHPWGLQVAGRRVLVDAFPQSVDVADIDRTAAAPAASAAAAALRASLGDPHRVLLAVDGLDPANGIEQRLVAYGELLDEGSLEPATTVLVQVATPDPLDTTQSRQLRARIQGLVGRINGRHGQVGRPAVHYLHQMVNLPELVSLYLASDVMLATPLSDGMSLPAKEYVAARRDDTGVLVLSEFTATAGDLPHAFTVNPHDIDQLKAAMSAAVTATVDTVGRRMAALRRHVRAHDVHDWAGRLLATLGASVPIPQQR